MNDQDQLSLMLQNPIVLNILINNLRSQQQFYASLIQQQQNLESVKSMKNELNVKLMSEICQNHIENNQLEKQFQQPLVHIDTSQVSNAKDSSDDEEESHQVNGHWSKQEHQMYLNFVFEHEDILKSKYDKKSKKIFKLMSQYIPTRTATQCRSHHQKFNPLQKKRKGKNINRQIPTVIIQQS